MAGVSRGWVPSRSPGDTTPPRAAPDDEEECELILQACAGRATPPGAPLAVRKLYLRLPRRAVASHAALPASGGLVRLDHPALDPEALAGALRCAALDAARLSRRLDGCGWAELCRLLDAARFLAHAPLLEGCEARLRRRLGLANAVALASASHRCGAAALQREAYFFLKAHFCSAARRDAPPCLTRTRIVHGEHAVPHEAWRGVRRAWARARLPLVAPQPRYTLCSLTRERRAGRVCVFKLRREHDGKLLLFARQRRAGEGEFLIFTPDGIEAPPEGTAGEAKEPVLVELTPREEPEDEGGELLPTAAAEDGVEGARLTASPVVEQPPDPTAEREAAEAARAAERARREAEQALRREENSLVDFIWALPADALPEHSERYCGALTATWLGLRHQLFDSGLTPEEPAHFPAPRRRELAAIVYESNVMKSRPNSMTVVVPDKERQRKGSAAGALLDSFGNPSAEGGVVVLKNLAPEWNEELEAYTLPFFQRVSLPSKKNIHIVNPDAPDDIVLLFGKRQKSITGKVTTFSLDFCRPLSTLAAFAVALSTFAGSK
ncbi:hypothetical protein AB1Y20_006937 [Prymnesium parvum]|uniref:Tubby C-terminal domain-containing protein n=1 Tax=Prymnesium parvum TaxID=97485 RepID=A0AB34J1T4_PRYPA